MPTDLRARQRREPDGPRLRGAWVPSAGYRGRDILDQSHVSSGPAMTDVLSKLIEMGLVQRRAPINDAQNKRKAGYFIVDSLSLFYYRCVFRYSSQRQLLDSDVFFDRYVGRDFEENYVPHVFEEILPSVSGAEEPCGRDCPLPGRLCCRRAPRASRPPPSPAASGCQDPRGGRR